eukprot:197016_1
MSTNEFELAVSIELGDRKEQSSNKNNGELYDEKETKYDKELQIYETKSIQNKNKKKKKKRGNVCLRLIELTFKAVTKGSSLLDAITDILLLITAASNGAILFTMILFITLLAPYILSYSSGVELFLYRKTFQNVEPFTFKSLLLLFYLLPTGILFFIMIDLVEMLQQVINFILFFCGKTKAGIAKIEQNTAEYFGMSRMDWLSFGQQKKIAQLFFETVPQVILQTLLYTKTISGKDISGITDRALLISVSSAVFNCIVTLVKLYAESRGVQETFVEYSLHSITARFGWVPFRKVLINYFNDNYNNMNNKPGCCGKWFSFKNLDSNDIILNYKIQYRVPIITYLSNESLKNSIVYDFSSNTMASFIAIIKSNYDSSNYNKSKKNKLSIRFGDSLRLLSVRQIITLMQACSSKQIVLSDIHAIDWNIAFENSKEDDPRLYANTFDENKKPLLTSLYLTGYDNELWFILKLFIHDFDTPINVQDDEGNTILHHMLYKKDFLAIKVLFDSLKPNQRINFNIRNDEGVILLHEIIKYQNIEGLKDVLSVLKPRQKINFNIKSNDGNTVFHYLIQQNKISQFEPMLGMIINNNNFIDFSTFNQDGQSMMYLAMEMDKSKLSKNHSNKDNYNRTQKTHLLSKMEDIVNKWNEKHTKKTETSELKIKDENKDDDNEDTKMDDTDNEEKNETDISFDNDNYDWKKFKIMWIEAVKRKVICTRTLVNILFLKLTQMMFKYESNSKDNMNENGIEEMNYRVASMYLLCKKDAIRRKIEDVIYEMNISENDRNSNTTKEECNDRYKSKMFHRILLKLGINVEQTIIINSKSMSALGYVLVHYFDYNEYFEIIDHLLVNNAKIMMNEMSLLVQ